MIRSLSRPAAALAVALAVATVLAANRRTGPFAVVDRASVFEDDKGVHVSVTNPRSVLRTVLMDDQKYEALIESHLQALLGLVSGAAFGTPAGEDYGQRREKGTIGKTMGVMAGGPFDDKVADVSVMAGEDWKGVAERVRVGLEKKGSFVDSMYRMKMYFEDAGKWAFMKNMGMPGSIADEISAQIRPAAAAR